MIYWPITPGAEYDIAFPNNLGITEADLEDESVDIEVRNTVGLWEMVGSGWIFDVISPLWLIIHQANPDDADPGYFPPAGEYEYRLRLGDRILSIGILIFGDYKPAQAQQYDDTPIEYEQYEQYNQ